MVQRLPTSNHKPRTGQAPDTSLNFFFFFVFCLFVVVVAPISWAAPAAYGGSQARG